MRRCWTDRTSGKKTENRRLVVGNKRENKTLETPPTNPLLLVLFLLLGTCSLLLLIVLDTKEKHFWQLWSWPQGLQRRRLEDLHCTRPSRLRTAFCRLRPWLRRVDAVCQRGPSSARQELCRLGLEGEGLVSMCVRGGLKGEGGEEEGKIFTERNAWILGPDVLTLFIGEEHVRRKTTFWGIGICPSHKEVSNCSPKLIQYCPKRVVKRVIIASSDTKIHEGEKKKRN